MAGWTTVAPGGRAKQVLRFAPRDVLTPDEVAALGRVSNTALNELLDAREAGRPATVEVAPEPAAAPWYSAEADEAPAPAWSYGESGPEDEVVAEAPVPVEVPAPAAAPNPGGGPRYKDRRARSQAYSQEFVAGSTDLWRFAARLDRMVQDQPDLDRQSAFMRLTGWSEADVAGWLDRLPRSAGGPGELPKVTELDEVGRGAYELRGYPFAQGDGTEPYDTGEAYSNHSGKGWAIFVMDDEGRIYAGSHKVGRFHHSSFLAGADVAAAGELKVADGEVRQVTNKSGHYHPGAAESLQFFHELARRGVDLDRVRYTHLAPSSTKAGELDVDLTTARAFVDRLAPPPAAATDTSAHAYGQPAAATDTSAYAYGQPAATPQLPPMYGQRDLEGTSAPDRRGYTVPPRLRTRRYDER